MSKKTWTQNPKFLLNFKDNVPTTFKVTLAIAEKNWKAKTKVMQIYNFMKLIEFEMFQNTVGGMIGIYLLEKREGKISIDQRIGSNNFLPVSVLEEEYNLPEISKSGYYIMPSTYQSKISGQFIISVTSSKEFTL